MSEYLGGCYTETWHLGIYDISGKTIFSKDCSLQEMSFVINTKEWPTGPYIVSIDQKGLIVVSEKIIKSGE